MLRRPLCALTSARNLNNGLTIAVAGSASGSPPGSAGKPAHALTIAHICFRNPAQHSNSSIYGMIATATLLGVGLNFAGLDPIKALFWSAVLNGVVAVPLMVAMMLMTARPRIMGRFTLPRGLAVMG